MFEERGFQKVAFEDSPDVFVINTCSVTENADRKCRNIVREAKKISPHSFVTVIGCYAQLKPKEIAEMSGVDAVLGASEKFKLFEYLNDFEKMPDTQVYACDVSQADTFYNSHSINDRTRTFLKVQDGCNYGCAFCTIPLARGKSRSDSAQNLLRKVEKLAISGVKEIVLTGVNIGDFGIREGHREENFCELVNALDRIDGIERFRISSIEPNLLTNEIIEKVSRSKKFVPHFHIPLQSGSDTILRLMDRRYRTDLYRHRIETIKSLMPNCCIGVDVIVGFPGESEKEFMKTYSFLNELNISYLHVFTYSERPNTKAAEMDDIVEPKVRAERSKMLRSLSDKKKRKFYESNIGKEAAVLFENDISEGYMYGFTENYIRVRAPHDEVLINQSVPVVLEQIDAEGVMIGGILERTLEPA